MTDLKVVPIHSGPTEITAELLTALGAIEREVKLGQIEAFIIVGIKRNGDIFGGRSMLQGIAHFALLGGMQQQVHELAQIITERSILTPPPEPEHPPD